MDKIPAYRLEAKTETGVLSAFSYNVANSGLPTAANLAAYIALLEAHNDFTVTAAEIVAQATGEVVAEYAVAAD